MIIHCDTTRYIFEVLEGQEYKFLFEDMIVLDVGCNIGTFSLWMLPHAQIIYAVDADEKATTLFKKTVADNGYTNIRVFTNEISGLDTAGTTSIASFMSANSIRGVDVLKLDVEGAELDIINAPDFPADRISTVVGEFHYSDDRRNQFRERFEELGYRYTEYPNSHFKAQR